MSPGSGRSVRFSNTGATRGILKNSDTPGRDSGIGSSSSDHTGSLSGDELDLDNRFTARDYGENNGADAPRDVLEKLLEDHKKTQERYAMLKEDYHKVDKLYEEERQENQRLKKRAKEQDDALAQQDRRIVELAHSNKKLEAEQSQQIKEYNALRDELELVREQLEIANEKAALQWEEEGADMKGRLKDRINRDTAPPSRSSHASSDSTTKRSSNRRLSIMAGDKPYKDNPMMSPTAPNYRPSSDYALAPVEPPRSSRRSAGSHRDRRDNREGGDYVAHPLPLPDRARTMH